MIMFKLCHSFKVLDDEEAKLREKLDRALRDPSECFLYDGYKTFATILRVVDGDTVDIAYFLPYMKQPMKARARIYGIDTPELRPRKNNPEREQVKRDAELAKMFLQSLVGAKTLHITCHGFDSFGRMLCEFFLDDGTNVGREMLRHGFAKVYERRRGVRRVRSVASTKNLSRELSCRSFP